MIFDGAFSHQFALFNNDHSSNSFSYNIFFVVIFIHLLLSMLLFILTLYYTVHNHGVATTKTKQKEESDVNFFFVR